MGALLPLCLEVSERTIGNNYSHPHPSTTKKTKFKLNKPTQSFDSLRSAQITE